MLKINLFEKIWQQVSKALKIFDPAIPLLINQPTIEVTKEYTEKHVKKS